MKSTQKESASIRSFDYLPVLPTGRSDFYTSLTLRQPLDLVASLPLLTGEDHKGQILVIFVEENHQRVFGVARFAIPTSEGEEREGLADLLCLANAHEHFGSSPIVLAAFADEGSGVEHERFLLTLLEELRPFSNPQNQICAFIVSEDCTSAIDLSDPDRNSANLEEPIAKLQRKLEEMQQEEQQCLAALFMQLEGTNQMKSPVVAAQLHELRKKGRTSTKYRRAVENSLYSWLTDLPESVELGNLVELGKFDSELAMDCASWIVGAADRRIREPLLKRLHTAAQAMESEQRSEFLDRARQQLVQLIQIAPTKETAALSSILALLSWQAGDHYWARVAVQFGREQDADNVLSQLVAGANAANLPPSAWADIMGDYSLTRLRSG